MVSQITHGGKDILDPHVDRLLGVIRALDQVEQVEPHRNPLESQAIVDGNHAVAVLVQEFEPGKHPRVIPLAHDETASEDEQDGRTLKRIAGNDGRLVNVHVQVAGVPLCDHIGRFLGDGEGGEKQAQEE